MDDYLFTDDGPPPGCDCEDCQDEQDFAAWEDEVL